MKADQKRLDQIPEYFEKNKSYLIRKQKEWQQKNKEKVHANGIKRKYNLTAEGYRELLGQQNYSCAICGQDQKELNRKLAVDHDHRTGKIRGLLCTTCNTKVVFVVEMRDHLIEKTREYLKRGL